MVATLMSLRWRLTLAGLRDNPWQIVLLVLTAPVLLGAVLLAAAASAVLGIHEVGLRRDLIVLLGSVVTCTALVVFVLVLGEASPLEPSRFQTLPVTARALRPGLLLTHVTTLSGVTLAGMALAPVLAWRQTTLTIAVALVAAVLTFGTALLGGLVLTAALSTLMQRRRTRELSVALLSISSLAFVLGPQALSATLSDGHGHLNRPPEALSTVLAWSPIGWSWALPGDAARSDWIALTLRALLATGLVVGLWKAWGYFLGRTLTSPIQFATESGTRSRGGRDAAWAGSPLGAVVLREIRYLQRDSRRWLPLMLFLIYPVFFIGAMQHTADPLGNAVTMAALIAATVSCSSAHQSLSYTGSSTWMDLAAGLRARTERSAAAIVSLMTTGLVTVLLGVAGVVLATPQSIAVLGMSIALVGVSIGAGTYTAVIAPIKMPPPGTSPFRANQANSSKTALVSFGLMLAIIPLTAPVLVLGILGWSGGPFAWLTLAVAPFYAAGALALGVHLAARRLERTWPEVLAIISA